MPDKKDETFFLKDCLNSIKLIREYIAGINFDGFIDDKKTQDAVVRNLEIIGEAIKNLPDDFRKKFPNI